MECVTQVGKDTGPDAELASSGDVAGCDEDLFNEEARAVVRVVSLQTPELQTPKALAVEFRFWRRRCGLVSV